jgi:hypothetical protein
MAQFRYFSTQSQWFSNSWGSLLALQTSPGFDSLVLGVVHESAFLAGTQNEKTF